MTATTRTRMVKGIARTLTGEELDSLIREAKRTPRIKAPRGQVLNRVEVSFICQVLGRAQ